MSIKPTYKKLATERIFTHSPIPMVLVDKVGDIIAYNEKFTELFGYTLDDISTANDWWNVAYPDSSYRKKVQSDWEAEVAHSQKTGKMVPPQIWEITCKDRTKSFVEFTMMPLGEESVIVMNDITERKRSEKELELTNEKYRHSIELLHYVISHARSAIAVHDRDLNYVYVSDRYLEEYGVKGKNVIGKHHYEVFPDLPQKWRDVHQRCLKGEVLSAEEDPYYREDGSVDWTRWECRPWYEFSDTIGGIIVYTEVITERKEFEERLRKSEEQLQLAIEGSGLGLWDWNLQTDETFFSDKYFSMLGYSPTEHPHTKETWEKLLHPDDKEYIFRILKDSLENDKPWELEFRLQTKSGDYKWVLSRGKVVEKDCDGSSLRAAGTHLDITERKQSEKDLLKLQKLESIGVLAGGIAHDFNNIMAAILGNVNLALLDSQLTPETHKLLMEAEKASMRAKDLTQQLLTFSKGGEPIKKAASLVEIVQDSAEFILHGNKAACKYIFPEDLWIVEIDIGQISQVVQNIVLNASQAMPDGGTIKISGENFVQDESGSKTILPVGNYVKLRIQDSGIGIPENIMGRVFDPYFSTKHKGSGFGLAIAHSVVTKHDGHIQVESTPGVGTIFTTFLPVAEQSSIDIIDEKSGNHCNIKAKIMVMDDEDQVRSMSQAMLTSMGHETVLAKDGEEALSLYEQAMRNDSPIDLIIMDLTIPGGMGGEEAIRKVLSLSPNAKVIVSSGYSTDPIMSTYQEYGFCAALVKPYRRKDLVIAINEAFTVP